MFLHIETSAGADMDLIEVFANVHERDEMEMLFDELFTSAEKNRLFLRWKLLKMLRTGVTQRKIASDLGISLCKITRGASILKRKNSILYRILNEGDRNGDSEN
jgi:TrpR family trp operon transcriptional repressor